MTEKFHIHSLFKIILLLSDEIKTASFILFDRSKVGITRVPTMSNSNAEISKTVGVDMESEVMV